METLNLLILHLNQIIINYCYCQYWVINFQQESVALMFLFQCCQSVKSRVGYNIRKKNKNNQESVVFVNSLKDVNEKDLKSMAIQIQAVETSEYDELIKQYKGKQKKWTDLQFPPDQHSLGSIPNVHGSQWKRISDLLNKPALFDGKIEPKDVIHGSLGDCYFLSALASLAQKQQRIKKVFSNQTYNPNGIYKVTLRIDGFIQQILVDDFIPVNTRGEPLFCQPNKNEFWVLILEKAWAKAHGSYANIIAGSPIQVFKAVTYAPAEVYSIKESEEERQRVWRLILEHSINDYPCCCTTDDRQGVDWQKIGLEANHAYTLVTCNVIQINAAQLQINNGKTYKILMLRNPWGKKQWQGEGSENDDEFWKNIKASQEKDKFLMDAKKSKDGIFYILYNDFCKYFTQIHFCMLEDLASYLSEQIFVNQKNASINLFTVQKPGTYTFQLHQPGIKGIDNEKLDDGLCRSTLFVAKSKQNNDYQFIDGVMKYNDEDTTLKTNLDAGKYILYSKLDPTRVKGSFPQKSSISVYSKNFVELVLSKDSVDKLELQLLRKMFLNHAKKNKRQTYNNDLMWIAWKLLFQQGGYAYIAFGNSGESNKKFVVTFDETQFQNLHFTLANQFRGKGNNQVLEVLPGQQAIIIARVKNLNITNLKFPPQIGIKLERLGGQIKQGLS